MAIQFSTKRWFNNTNFNDPAPINETSNELNPANLLNVAYNNETWKELGYFKLTSTVNASVIETSVNVQIKIGSNSYTFTGSNGVYTYTNSDFTLKFIRTSGNNNFQKEYKLLIKEADIQDIKNSIDGGQIIDFDIEIKANEGVFGQTWTMNTSAEIKGVNEAPVFGDIKNDDNQFISTSEISESELTVSPLGYSNKTLFKFKLSDDATTYDAASIANPNLIESITVTGDASLQWNRLNPLQGDFHLFYDPTTKEFYIKLTEKGANLLKAEADAGETLNMNFKVKVKDTGDVNGITNKLTKEQDLTLKVFGQTTSPKVFAAAPSVNIAEYDPSAADNDLSKQEGSPSTDGVMRVLAAFEVQGANVNNLALTVTVTAAANNGLQLATNHYSVGSIYQAGNGKYYADVRVTVEGEKFIRQSVTTQDKSFIIKLSAKDITTNEVSNTAETTVTIQDGPNSITEPTMTAGVGGEITNATSLTAGVTTFDESDLVIPANQISTFFTLGTLAITDKDKIDKLENLKLEIVGTNYNITLSPSDYSISGPVHSNFKRTDNLSFKISKTKMDEIKQKLGDGQVLNIKASFKLTDYDNKSTDYQHTFKINGIDNQPKLELDPIDSDNTVTNNETSFSLGSGFSLGKIKATDSDLDDLLYSPTLLTDPASTAKDDAGATINLQASHYEIIKTDNGNTISLDVKLTAAGVEYLDKHLSPSEKLIVRLSASAKDLAGNVVNKIFKFEVMGQNDAPFIVDNNSSDQFLFSDIVEAGSNQTLLTLVNLKDFDDNLSLTLTNSSASTFNSVNVEVVINGTSLLGADFSSTGAAIGLNKYFILIKENISNEAINNYDEYNYKVVFKTGGKAAFEQDYLTNSDSATVKFDFKAKDISGAERVFSKEITVLKTLVGLPEIKDISVYQGNIDTAASTVDKTVIEFQESDLNILGFDPFIKIKIYDDQVFSLSPNGANINFDDDNDVAANFSSISGKITFSYTDNNGVAKTIELNEWEDYFLGSYGPTATGAGKVWEIGYRLAYGQAGKGYEKIKAELDQGEVANGTFTVHFKDAQNNIVTHEIDMTIVGQGVSTNNTPPTIVEATSPGDSNPDNFIIQVNSSEFTGNNDELYHFRIEDNSSILDTQITFPTTITFNYGSNQSVILNYGADYSHNTSSGNSGSTYYSNVYFWLTQSGYDKIHNNIGSNPATTTFNISYTDNVNPAVTKQVTFNINSAPTNNVPILGDVTRVGDDDSTVDHIKINENELTGSNPNLFTFTISDDQNLNASNVSSGIPGVIEFKYGANLSSTLQLLKASGDYTISTSFSGLISVNLTTQGYNKIHNTIGSQYAKAEFVVNYTDTGTPTQTATKNVVYELNAPIVPIIAGQGNEVVESNFTPDVVLGEWNIVNGSFNGFNIAQNLQINSVINKDTSTSQNSEDTYLIDANSLKIFLKAEVSPDGKNLKIKFTNNDISELFKTVIDKNDYSEIKLKVLFSGTESNETSIKLVGEEFSLQANDNVISNNSEDITIDQADDFDENISDYLFWEDEEIDIASQINGTTYNVNYSDVAIAAIRKYDGVSGNYTTIPVSEISSSEWSYNSSNNKLFLSKDALPKIYSGEYYLIQFNAKLSSGFGNDVVDGSFVLSVEGDGQPPSTNDATITLDSSSVLNHDEANFVANSPYTLGKVIVTDNNFSGVTYNVTVDAAGTTAKEAGTNAAAPFVSLLPSHYTITETVISGGKSLELKLTQAGVDYLDKNLSATEKVTLNLQVTETDSTGGSKTENFKFVVQGQNDAPYANDNLPSQSTYMFGNIVEGDNTAPSTSHLVSFDVKDFDDDFNPFSTIIHNPSPVSNNGLHVDISINNGSPITFDSFGNNTYFKLTRVTKSSEATDNFDEYDYVITFKSGGKAAFDAAFLPSSNSANIKFTLSTKDSSGLLRNIEKTITISKTAPTNTAPDFKEITNPADTDGNTAPNDKSITIKESDVKIGMTDPFFKVTIEDGVENIDLTKIKFNEGTGDEGKVKFTYGSQSLTLNVGSDIKMFKSLTDPKIVNFYIDSSAQSKIDAFKTALTQGQLATANFIMKYTDSGNLSDTQSYTIKINGETPSNSNDSTATVVYNSFPMDANHIIEDDNVSSGLELARIVATDPQGVQSQTVVISNTNISGIAGFPYTFAQLFAFDSTNGSIAVKSAAVTQAIQAAITNGEMITVTCDLTTTITDLQGNVTVVTKPVEFMIDDQGNLKPSDLNNGDDSNKGVVQFSVTPATITWLTTDNDVYDSELISGLDYVIGKFTITDASGASLNDTFTTFGPNGTTIVDPDYLSLAIANSALGAAVDVNDFTIVPEMNGISATAFKVLIKSGSLNDFKNATVAGVDKSLNLKVIANNTGYDITGNNDSFVPVFHDGNPVTNTAPTLNKISDDFVFESVVSQTTVVAEFNISDAQNNVTTIEILNKSLGNQFNKPTGGTYTFDELFVLETNANKTKAFIKIKSGMADELQQALTSGEQGLVIFKIKVTDAGGLSTEQDITIGILGEDNNNNPVSPTINWVNSTANLFNEVDISLNTNLAEFTINDNDFASLSALLNSTITKLIDNTGSTIFGAGATFDTFFTLVKDLPNGKAYIKVKDQSALTNLKAALTTGETGSVQFQLVVNDSNPNDTVTQDGSFIINGDGSSGGNPTNQPQITNISSPVGSYDSVSKTASIDEANLVNNAVFFKYNISDDANINLNNFNDGTGLSFNFGGLNLVEDTDYTVSKTGNLANLVFEYKLTAQGAGKIATVAGLNNNISTTSNLSVSYNDGTNNVSDNFTIKINGKTNVNIDVKNLSVVNNLKADQIDTNTIIATFEATDDNLITVSQLKPVLKYNSTTLNLVIPSTMFTVEPNTATTGNINDYTIKLNSNGVIVLNDYLTNYGVPQNNNASFNLKIDATAQINEADSINSNIIFDNVPSVPLDLDLLSFESPVDESVIDDVANGGGQNFEIARFTVADDTVLTENNFVVTLHDLDSSYSLIEQKPTNGVGGATDYFRITKIAGTIDEYSLKLTSQGYALLKAQYQSIAPDTTKHYNITVTADNTQGESDSLEFVWDIHDDNDPLPDGWFTDDPAFNNGSGPILSINLDLQAGDNYIHDGLLAQNMIIDKFYANVPTSLNRPNISSKAVKQGLNDSGFNFDLYTGQTNTLVQTNATMYEQGTTNDKITLTQVVLTQSTLLTLKREMLNTAGDNYAVIETEVTAKNLIPDNDPLTDDVSDIRTVKVVVYENDTAMDLYPIDTII